MTQFTVDWYHAITSGLSDIYWQELSRKPDEGGWVEWFYHVREEGHDLNWVRARIRETAEWHALHDAAINIVDPPAVQPPTALVPKGTRLGLVRASGRMFTDDTGLFRPFGATLFWALRGWKYERDRVKQNLDWLDDHGVNYVRILSQVGWPGNEIDPVWPDYVAQLADFLDTAYNTFGMRTEITCVGGGGNFSPLDLVRKVVAAVKGREHTVMHLEIANEYFATFNNVDAMRDMATILHQQLPNLLAPSSPGGGNEIELSALMATGPYTMATVHKQRQEGDRDWRFVRQNWDYKDKPWPVSNNEPKGPLSSVSPCSDPLRLAMDRAVGIMCGVGAYVLHNGNGIYGVPNDNAGGGHRNANVWELDNVDAIYDAVAHVDSLIPTGVENWSNANDGWMAPNPVHPLPVPVEQFWEIGRGDHGVNKNYAAVNGSTFVCMPCGVLNYVELRARQPCSVAAYNPVTRQLVETRGLAAGEVWKLAGDAGANTAYVIVGSI